MALFLSTLDQMGYLFSLILIGFFLVKAKIMPQSTAGILSKLENVLFVPALVLGTFMSSFTTENLKNYFYSVSVSTIIMFVMLPVAVFLPKLLVKDGYTRKIYTYGIEFANFGFMGNSVVAALFPDLFAEYLIYSLPLYILIYAWSVPFLLIPVEGEGSKLRSALKNLLNPMLAGVLIGILFGLFSVKLPSFAVRVIDICGSCMSPVAMLLTGMTVASADFKKLFGSVPVYILSIIRLIIIPLVFIGIFAVLPKGFLPQSTVICAMCALSMPLGLNTIVIPAAYGKDTTAATGMALISHTLSCVTIPLIFAVMNFII
jgi:predicted permease